ncbi:MULTISPECIES: hypothetical protein [Streptomyces]|uniref:Nuclear transport factor 2 family protein n=1 Tax=Streptomyces cinereoruber TaxID=67260 RepID=A0ABX6BLU0_9ACTN|nr:MULTISPECIES: hypothetical protein [Streptomyces]AVH94180.1 hypothetical protein C5L38_03145 [Streptomyces sp. WAC00288]KYG51397.1 hypothetical protein AWI43_28580 [Streptomyces sp. WAC04657]MBB4162318.1 hypothetical protein [Streptomyces cinereoruber]MBY8820108.1 hypothetical protein [Streptomyces cinereoruber]NIH63421.1 hypothetical protein [Streptomyces cinereoruber]
MPEKTPKELAESWLRALSDVDLFYEFCAPDCRVWHSSDDKWMSLKGAIDAVHSRGGLPPFRNSRYTLTDKGFIVQTSTTLDGTNVHIIQVATVEGGQVVSAEEYIGPEMNIAV